MFSGDIFVTGVCIVLTTRIMNFCRQHFSNKSSEMKLGVQDWLTVCPQVEHTVSTLWTGLARPLSRYNMVSVVGMRSWSHCIALCPRGGAGSQ